MTPSRLALPVLALLLAAVPAARAADPAPAAAPALPAEDLAVLEEALSFRDARFAKDKAGLAPEAKTAYLMEKWGALDAEVQGLFLRKAAWMRSHVREGLAPAYQTDRGRALLIAGAPGLVHSEAARDWTGAKALKNDGLADLLAILGEGDKAVRALLEPGSAAPAALPVAPVEGAHPTEIWVYSISAGHRRVLSFVDREGSGLFRLVADDIVPATTSVSTAPAQELPADLFPVAAAGSTLLALPALTVDAVKPLVLPHFFKALEGKTLARFAYAIDPTDVELELDSTPEAYAAKAQAWLQVERGGQPLWQDRVVLAQSAPLVQDGLWLLEFSVPLPPGEYTWTAVVTDGAGKGGRATGPLVVPSLSGLGLSSVLIVQAEGTGDAATLPLAPDAAAVDLAPFQVGKYLARPRVKGSFKAGETLVVVYQVYGTQPSTVSCHFFRDGKYQPGLDDTNVTQYPFQEALMQDVTDAWPAGSYKVVVTATDKADPSKTVSQEASFRVAN